MYASRLRFQRWFDVRGATGREWFVNALWGILWQFNNYNLLSFLYVRRHGVTSLRLVFATFVCRDVILWRLTHCMGVVVIVGSFNGNSTTVEIALNGQSLSVHSLGQSAAAP